MEPAALKAHLLERARRFGFELAGVAAAGRADTAGPFRRWLEEGHAGEMRWMERDPDRRSEPARVWPEARSVLVVGLNYRTWEPPPSVWDDPSRGRIARYALGDDYHDLMLRRLRGLLEEARREVDPGLEGRAYVDAGPLLERDLGVRAGLGWFGKNTCLLHREQGSYFFLGALLLNRELPADAPTSAHCGTCTRCLDVCPTGAFVAPYVLDARRCISYLTIELRGPIPRELRPLVGNWVFGCDLCQEVCPWNRKTARGTDPELAPRPDLQAPELVELLAMSREEYRERFRGSPVRRAKYGGLLRNVCVALGNSGDPRAAEALVRALEHEEPLVRGHAAWALGRLHAAGARTELRGMLEREPEPWVREEAVAALAELESSNE